MRPAALSITLTLDQLVDVVLTAMAAGAAGAGSLKSDVTQILEWTKTMDPRMNALETAVNTIRDNFALLPPILADIKDDETNLQQQITDLKASGGAAGLPGDLSAKLDTVLATATDVATGSAGLRTALQSMADLIPPVAPVVVDPNPPNPI